MSQTGLQCDNLWKEWWDDNGGKMTFSDRPHFSDLNGISENGSRVGWPLPLQNCEPANNACGGCRVQFIQWFIYLFLHKIKIKITLSIWRHCQNIDGLIHCEWILRALQSNVRCAGKFKRIDNFMLSGLQDWEYFLDLIQHDAHKWSNRCYSSLINLLIYFRGLFSYSYLISSQQHKCNLVKFYLFTFLIISGHESHTGLYHASSDCKGTNNADGHRRVYLRLTLLCKGALVACS